jgi:HAT1-interacting factor 1
MLGQTQPDQKQRIAEATANANDLSSLVKKKKSKPSTTETAATKQAEKRKLDHDEDGEAATEEGVGKKAKVEEKSEQVDLQKTA